MEEASDIYVRKIQKLMDLLMRDVNNLNGTQFLREVHSIWTTMRTIIKAFENPCAQINTYLKDFGKNDLAEDHPLRDRSTVVAEGVRIVRQTLIEPNLLKIGRLLLDEIFKLRSNPNSENQQITNDMLEEMFQSFIVCD